MSLIEKYKTTKRRTEHIKIFLEEINNLYTDKFGVQIELKKTWLGHYGSSSVYSWPDAVQEELCNLICKKSTIKYLLSKVIENLETEVDKTKKDAASEAREILEGLD